MRPSARRAPRGALRAQAPRAGDACRLRAVQEFADVAAAMLIVGFSAAEQARPASLSKENENENESPKRVLLLRTAHA